MTVKTARVQRSILDRLQSGYSVKVLVIMLAWAVCGELGVAQHLAPQNPRELLQLHGIHPSQLDRFQDDEPLGATDEETLIRVLQRMPRFRPNTLERWSRPQPDDWSAIASAPTDHRAAIFRLSGRVTRLERSPLSPELASRLEFAEYFRVTLQLSGSNHVVIVCTRNVPRAWLTGGPIDEPAGALGIFVKTGARVDGVSQLVFVAERATWFPQRENAAYNAASAHVYLARLGFDVGLIDDVRAENKKPLSLADRECFYQLLAAVRKAERSEFMAQSAKPLEIVPVLRDPAAFHGKLFVLEGIARRAIRVRVNDPDIRERFGCDHYYQIDLFVDLNKQVVKLGNEQSDKAFAIFENSFPVTVCVPSLPPDLPESDTLRENVRVHAVFLKLWTYSSDYVSSFDKKLMQVSPILIGIEPRVIRPVAFNSGAGYLLAAVTALSVIGIWVGLRRQGSRIRVPRERSSVDGNKNGTAKQDEEAALPDRPDFTNLT